MTFGAETLSELEIDQPFCSETYGVGNCHAVLGVTGPCKCYNTRFTCQFPTAYNPSETKVLKFVRPADALTHQYGYVLPLLDKAPSITPGAVNLGGMDPNLKAFGAREKASAVLNDLQHEDLVVDKYRTERLTGEAAVSAGEVHFEFLNKTLVPQHGKELATLTLTRSGVATRVNESGLIEVVGVDTPRWDIHPITLAVRGLILEDARTNYIIKFNEFDDSSWVKRNGHSVTANAGVAPDGTTTADLITASSPGATDQGVYQEQAANGNKTYSGSVYLKTNSGALSVKMILKDRSTDTVRGSATIALTSGWQRLVDCTGTTAGGTTGFRLEFQALATGSFYAWGAQCEEGPESSSVIPTTTTSVARGLDDAKVTNISGFYSATVGTIVAEFELNNPAANEDFVVASFNDNTTNERLGLYVDGPGALVKMYDVDGGSILVNSGSVTVITPNTVVRAAVAYQANNFRFSLNGEAVVVDSTATLPTVTQLQIGKDPNASSLNGRLLRLTYYPRALSDLELQRVAGGLLVHPSALVTFTNAFDPYEQGTFWGKWLARNPYYMNYNCRVRFGEVGTAFADMKTLNYILDRIDGPDGGQVKLTAKDVFSKLDDDKAVAPKLSRGSLVADITNVAASLTLTPAGIGDLEYPTSGRVRIKDEVIAFTRSLGSDVLTLTTRGDLNTVAEAHKQEDLAQLVLSFITRRPHDIAYVLTTQYGGMDPARINFDQWTINAAAITELYTAHITEPTPVQDLVGELAQQAGFTIWPETSTGMIEFAALRAAAPIAEVDEDGWILRYDDPPKRLVQSRASEQWVRYAQNDPTKDLSQNNNFRSTYVNPDFPSESPQQYGSPAIKEINSRWIPPFGRPFASNLSSRQLAMFRDPPYQTAFTIPADRDTKFGLTKLFTLVTPSIQGVTGKPNPTLMAVTKITRGEDETRIDAQQVTFFQQDVTTERIIHFDLQGLRNLNMREIHDSIYIPPTGVETVTFICDPGITVGSTDVTVPAVRTGIWPAGVTLKLIVQSGARLQGKGGDGAPGQVLLISPPDFPGAPDGQTGGTAFKAEVPISVDNQGQMWGGGGGGGGGGTFSDAPFGGASGGGGGGPGAGTVPGTVGTGRLLFPGYPSIYDGHDSGSADDVNPGSGGTSGAYGAGFQNPGQGGDGGVGGGPGLPGTNGGVCKAGNPGFYQPPTNGGAAGKYVEGNSFITWINNGDRRGGVS